MKFLKNFTDKQVYLSLAFVSIALVAAVAGVRNLRSEQQKIEMQQEIESSQFEPVISSKNAEAEAGTYDEVSEVNANKNSGGENPSEEPKQETSENSGTFGLIWPVSGNIVMDYSVDHGIFDATLNQYRTNDSVCISANEGTNVKASAAGTVTSIITDSKNGLSVVIDHGNGWETTYGQLKDISVSEGSMVNKGQVIGSIAAPSKYSVLLGSHLDFTVSYNDDTVDPKDSVTNW